MAKNYQYAIVNENGTIVADFEFEEVVKRCLRYFIHCKVIKL